MRTRTTFRLTGDYKFQDMTPAQVKENVFKTFEKHGLPREDIAELKLEIGAFHRHEIVTYYVSGEMIIFRKEYIDLLNRFLDPDLKIEVVEVLLNQY